MSTGRRLPSWASETKRPDTIRAISVQETTAAHLLAFIYTSVDPKARKFTDENRAYYTRKNHYTIRHGDRVYIQIEVHINGMESFRALARRGYNGTFCRIEPKHLHRYINKFAGGWAQRRWAPCAGFGGQETYTCPACGARHAVWPAPTFYSYPNPECYVI